VSGGYVVTVTVPGCGSPCGGEPECERVVESRQEVDTLAEAIEAAIQVGVTAGRISQHFVLGCEAIMPEGGSVSLPGSTITVERKDGESR